MLFDQDVSEYEQMIARHKKTQRAEDTVIAKAEADAVKVREREKRRGREREGGRESLYIVIVTIVFVCFMNLSWVLIPSYTYLFFSWI